VKTIDVEIMDINVKTNNLELKSRVQTIEPKTIGNRYYWKQLENKQEMKYSRFMKCNNCIN
jgi:hypothetical protein